MSDIVESLRDGSPSQCWHCGEWGCINKAGHDICCMGNCDCETDCDCVCAECGGDDVCTCDCHEWCLKVRDAADEIGRLREASRELFMEAKSEAGRSNRVSHLYGVEMARSDALLHYIISLCAETHCAQGETAPCVRCAKQIDGIVVGGNTPVEPKPLDVESLGVGGVERNDDATAGPADDTSELRKVSRILWNRRPENDQPWGGDIDEIVCHDATVHVEQMNASCWWIGVYGPENQYWSGNFIADRYGRMHFSQQDDEWDWDFDQSHDRNE